MTRFQDGPAKGTTLMLKRAPFLLRVVEFEGKIDALDLLHHTPKDYEKIYAYKWVFKPGRALVDGAKFSGLYMVAEYVLIVPQPADDQMRKNVAWEQWCDSQAALYEEWKRLIA